MVSEELTDVIARADRLSHHEQLLLIAHVAENAAKSIEPVSSRRSLMEFQGIAPYPLFEEDAQTWVTRTRRQSDEARDLHRNHTS
jgi:hypothetical protein